MRFQQIVVPDMDLTVLKDPLSLLDDRVEVFALENIVHVEPVGTKVLDKILRRISVITHLQGEYLVFLY